MGLEIGRQLSKLRISFLNFKYNSTIVISGLSLCHSSVKQGKNEFLKAFFLQWKLSTLSDCRVLEIWLDWGITLKKWDGSPDCWILKNIQSLLKYLLNFKDSRPNFLYILVWEVPLIAPVISKAAFYIWDSSFWHKTFTFRLAIDEISIITMRSKKWFMDC